MYNKDTYNRNPYKRPFEQLLIGKNNLIGVEVGVYRGQHAREMLELLSIKTLILVDSWKDYKEYKDNPLKKQVAGAYFDAKELLERWNKKSKLRWIKNFSIKASKEIPDNTLDFIYFDGNHQYKYLKMDLKYWVPKVKKGGLIGGHDYIKKFPGVKKAVNEYCSKNKIQFKIKNGNLAPYYTKEDGNADWAFIKGGIIKKWKFELEDKKLEIQKTGGGFKPL